MTRPARCRRGKSTLSALPQFWSCARIGLAALLIIQPGTQTMAYEEPEYQVVRVYQDFEIRRYLPQLVAETVVDGEFSDVGGQAFRILAGYISGNNRNGEKISMTAPVSQRPGGEQIESTAPVSQARGEDGRYALHFFLPSRYTVDDVPEPTDDRVQIRQIPQRWLAASRYSGGWSEARYRSHEEKLLDAVRREGLETVGAPVFARYNSPFTLWFVRRNEVLIQLDEETLPGAGDMVDGGPTEMIPTPADSRLLAFDSSESGLWRSVNDGVMGGLSRGSLRIGAGSIGVFEGEVSLANNGGFASARATIGPRNLSAREGLRIRAMGDGRTYRLRLHDTAGLDGIAYQAEFDTQPGQWQTVTLPFSAFQPTFRGRVPPDAPPLDTGRIEQVGLMIADGQQGSFRLELDWITAFDRSSGSVTD